MCSECDIESVIREADALQLQFGPLLEASRTSSFEGDQFAVTQGKFRTRLQSAAKSLKRGNITPAQFEARWASAMNGAYPEAFRMGAAQHTGSSITKADRTFLRRAVRNEMGFASNFANDIATKNLTPKQIAARTDQYALGLESMKTSGWTRKGPENVIYIWRLSPANHCPDCLSLADLEFTRDSLPTVPRGGDTCITTPESRVLTSRGWIPIACVRVGDLAMTHRGRWRRVSATFQSLAHERQGATLLGPWGHRVGLTADHRMWTDDGWQEATMVAWSLFAMYNCGHDEDLRKMRLRDASQYDEAIDLQAMRIDLRVRGEQGFSSDQMQAMCCPNMDASQDGRSRETSRAQCREALASIGTMGGPRTAGADLREHLCGARENETALGSSSCRALCSGCQRLLASALLRSEGRETHDDQSVSLGLVAEHRDVAAGRSSHPPQESRSRRRPIREPRMFAGEGSFATALGCERAGADGVAGCSSSADLGMRALRTPISASGAEARSGRYQEPEVLLDGVLARGTILYDLTVEEDHSFIVEGVAVSNSCRSNCKCWLEVKTETPPRRDQAVATTNPELASGRKQVGRAEPSATERARIDDLRARINYHRRRIETATTEAAKKAAIQARRQANAELIQFQQATGIRDVPLLDVGDVITRRVIEPEVASGLAIRGLDGTTIALSTIAEWKTTQAALLSRIDELLLSGGGE